MYMYEGFSKYWGDKCPSTSVLYISKGCTVNATGSNPSVLRRNLFTRSPNLTQSHLWEYLPLPSQCLYQNIRQIISNSRLCIRRLNIRQRMRKTHRRTPMNQHCTSSRGIPRHSKHNPYRNTQTFCTVDMSKTWRICNYCICNKVVLNAGSPTSFNHCIHHFSSFLDFSSL